MKASTGLKCAGTIMSLAAAFFPAGCSRQAEPPLPAQPYSRLANFTDCGNGIYMYPNSADIGYALSDFRAAHPDLRLVSVTQANDRIAGQHGDDGLPRYSDVGLATGFVIVTECNQAESIGK